MRGQTKVRPVVNHRPSIASALVCVSSLFAASASLGDDNRAQIDYMLHCQGCHLPAGAGVPEHVPRLNGFLGYFLHSNAGREFIVQVPGAATSNLSDDRLAELMNWMLLTYSAGELPDNFQQYSSEEIAKLRQHLQADPEHERMRILRDIAVSNDVLASILEHDNAY